MFTDSPFIFILSAVVFASGTKIQIRIYVRIVKGTPNTKRINKTSLTQRIFRAKYLLTPPATPPSQ